MIDRKVAPGINAIQQIDYIKAEKLILENGIPVFYINAAEQEVVKIDFVFDAGTWQQEERLIASITASMLQEGSAHYSSKEIAEIFDFYGAYIQTTADQNYATVSIFCLNKYLPEIVKLTEDIIKRPVFPQSNLEVLIQKQKQKFRQENEKVKVLCQKKFTSVLFGEDHPYAINNRIENFDAISAEKLKSFFSKWYHSGNCRIFVAGNADYKVRTLIQNYFGKEEWRATNAFTVNQLIKSSSTFKHEFKKDNALQTAIRIGKHWVNKDHPDYCGLSVLITILGGYFGSRLMMNIREDKGYTYGVGAYVISLKNAAYLAISTEVDNSYTEDTLLEITKEMKRLQQELVPEEELEMVRSYLLGEFLRDFDGPFALSEGFRAINDMELDYDFYDHYLAVVNTITAQELQRLSNQYLLPEEMYTVTVGGK